MDNKTDVSYYTPLLKKIFGEFVAASLSNEIVNYL